MRHTALSLNAVRIRCLTWILALGMTLCATLAAANPIALSPNGGSVDLWSGATMRTDPDHRLTLDAVLASPQAFAPPDAPYANLGMRNDTVWLKVPVVAPAGTAGHWWFIADYAALDHIELYVVQGGRTLQHAVLGDHLLVSERPFPGRTHTVELRLPPGEPVDLLVKVRTTSTMVLPMFLRDTNAMVGAETAFQAWHGVAIGFGLCVLAFGITGAIVTRESLYLWFSLSVVSGTLFFFSFFGLAQQYFWPEHRWLVQNSAPLLMFLVLAWGFLFAERSLDVRAMHPRLGRAMQAMAVVMLLLAVAFCLGLMSYRGATAISSIVGTLPVLMCGSVAVRRARDGDRAAMWTLAGWVIYGIGVGTATALGRGAAPATTLMREAYMLSAMLNIVAWIMVINVRVADLRQKAASAQREHDRVLLISQTDPLTGLLNRRGLQLGLQPLVDQSGTGRLTAVYLLDLDGFKPVNDQHGHDAGDELLIQMGERLKQAVRANDLVARLGGDEFVVVASQLGGDAEAEVVGQKLLSCSDAPFQLTHTRCSVGITVGYAVADTPGVDAAELLRRADAAMYGGKQAGKRRVRRDTDGPAGAAGSLATLPRTA